MTDTLFTQSDSRSAEQFLDPAKTLTLLGTEDPLLKERYVIEKEIGRGGFGVVYLGRDRELLSRQIVIKVLLNSAQHDKYLKRKFLQEIEALTRIDHPGVVGILDAGSTADGNSFIVMQYIAGGSLRQAMQPGGMNLQRVARIVQQSGSALNAAHEKKVHHRDLKPENIMLQCLGGDEEQVKIIDFGIARVKDSVVATNKESTAFAGTFLYMAPEQLNGRPVASSDIFALGLISYEMLTGKHPFNPASPFELLELHKCGVKTLPVELRKDVPERAQEVILRALRFNPEDRHSSIRDFGNELSETLLTGQRALWLADTERAPFRQIPNPPLSTDPDLEATDPMMSRIPILSVPTEVTPFVGRQAEISSAVSLLKRPDVRLLTFLGPGGIGKSRLSLEVAKELDPFFCHGVLDVQLSEINDSDLVVSAIAHALNLKEGGSTTLTETVIAGLRDKNMLLLLDNFEHLVPAASLLSELFVNCPHVKFLVTSRIPLKLRAENEFVVNPLELPDLKKPLILKDVSRMSAVALFEQRARAVQPGFVLTPENISAVAEICVNLDGLPLAIELAAARVKMFSPSAMLPRLERLLNGGPSDLPSRQRTIQSTIAWSYDLLDDAEQKLFSWLSVFVGGFTLTAAEIVCRYITDAGLDIVDGVSSLLDKSLLVRDGELADEPRFTMLSTIRHYGNNRLISSGEIQTLQRTHAEYFKSFSDQAELILKGIGQSNCLEHLDKDHNNLRAALGWAKESGSIDLGLGLVSSLVRFWEVRGHLTEGRRWIQEILEKDAESQASPSVRARALNVAGILARNQGDYSQATEFLTKGLSLFRESGDKSGIAFSLNTLGLVAYDQSDDFSAEAFLHQALTLYRELDDKAGMSSALNNLAVLKQFQGAYEEAVAFQEESISIRRVSEDELGLASSLNNLGVIALDRNDLDRAAALFTESRGLFEKIGDKLGMGTSLTNLGEMAQHKGDYEVALSLYNEALVLFQDAGDKREEATLLSGLADIACHQGDYKKAGDLYKQSVEMRRSCGETASVAYSIEGLAVLACKQTQMERAATLLGGADALREFTKTPLSPVRLEGNNCNLELVRNSLGDGMFWKKFGDGKSMKFDDLISYALA